MGCQGLGLGTWQMSCDSSYLCLANGIHMKQTSQIEYNIYIYIYIIKIFWRERQKARIEQNRPWVSCESEWQKV